MMRSTDDAPELADGWSFPITPDEVGDYFPDVGSILWRKARSKRTIDWSKRNEVLLFLSWHPRIARPQPILMVRAIPSCRHAEVRKWIGDVVALESRAWLEALPTQSAAWRERSHVVSWHWRPAMESAE
jgi:hypothetical protein